MNRCRTQALLVALFLVIAAWVAPATGAAATVPPQFVDEAVTALGRPTAIAFPPDGRILLATQPGRLRVFEGGVLLPIPALDLSAKACSNRERELLGIAVDPAFATNGFVYAYYTVNKHGGCLIDSPTQFPVNRVSRFTLGAGDVIDPASERVLIDNLPSFHGDHNAGDLTFGSDGLLYVSVGDGACSLLAATRCAADNDISRRLDYPLGKILRITRDGSVPTANPFAAASGARNCTAPAGVPAGSGPCRETFAWGLRNPFRIAMQPGTNRLYIPRDIVAWRNAMELAKRIYVVTKDWPLEDRYGLTSQVRRSAVSVPANIAEGHGRASIREFLHHLSIANGSLREVETLLEIAWSANYLPETSFAALMVQCDQTRRPLRGLYGYLKGKL